MNKSRVAVKELISVKDVDFNPSGVACHDQLVYVSQKLENQIRVYDKNLRLTRIISLTGIVTSPHHALAVNEQVRVLLDGMDSVGLFDAPNLKGSKNNVCHFYTNKNCLEDLHVPSSGFAQSDKTSIFVADSCDKDVKQFVFAKEERMQLIKRYKIPAGKPVSMVTMPSEHLLVLTHSPRKVYVFDMKTCK